MMAYMGMAVSDWTYFGVLPLSRFFIYREERIESGNERTFAIVRQKGRPRSRPKAKTMRDEVARKAIAAQMSIIMMMHIMVDAPDSEPVAS